MDLMKLPNVQRSTHDKHEADYINQLDKLRKYHPELEGVADADIPLVPSKAILGELVSKLVIEKPQWQFRVHNFYAYLDDRLCWNDVEILSQYGEQLGLLRLNKRYGKEIRDVLEVHNHRVSAARERTRFYSTASVQAAVREVKKSFYEKTVDELLTDAESEASNAMNGAKYEPKHKVFGIKRDFEGNNYQLVDYVIDHHKEHFSVWLDSKRGWASGKTLEMVNSMVENQTIVDTVEEVERAFSGNKTALIIKNQGGYILRIDSEVKLCDDSTLPENIKAKLGMLKLVQESQVVSNVGCRVNKETFVVVLGATEEQ